MGVYLYGELLLTKVSINANVADYVQTFFCFFVFNYICLEQIFEEDTGGHE